MEGLLFLSSLPEFHEFTSMLLQSVLQQNLYTGKIQEKKTGKYNNFFYNIELYTRLISFLHQPAGNFFMYSWL